MRQFSPASSGTNKSKLLALYDCVRMLHFRCFHDEQNDLDLLIKSTMKF